MCPVDPPVKAVGVPRPYRTVAGPLKMPAEKMVWYPRLERRCRADRSDHDRLWGTAGEDRRRGEASVEADQRVMRVRMSFLFRSLWTVSARGQG
jgi:hypothetical protein